MKLQKGFIIDITISILSIIVCMIFLIFEIQNKNFLGVILLGLNIYLISKCRKNKLLLFSFLIIFYFNYSFVITKYLGTSSQLLENLYMQLNYDSTMYIGITLQIILLSVVNIFLNDVKENISINKKVTEFKYRKILILILQIILVCILLFHIINSINRNTTLFEYSIFIFIIALFYSKNDMKNRIILEVILLAFCIYSLKNGDRIAVLQFLLVDFIINYLEKFKVKYIIVGIIAGILIFTFAGLYGDFLLYGWDFENLTFEYFIDQIIFRRFALDTSVSAYFSGISMIDLVDKYSIGDRLINGLEYFFKYTFLGGSSGYKTLDIIIREYQVNYGGGLPTCYFYFWFGWLGVIFISIYIAFLYRTIKNNCENKYSEYKEVLSIFIISTIPRWYLYTPTMLFRGILLFTIFYFIIYLFFKKLDIFNNKFKLNFGRK